MNLTTLSWNSRNLHFCIHSIIYYHTNFCKICYRAKSLQLETTVHQGATVLEGKEINSYITKMLSSRLQSKTSKNNLPHKQNQQDPPERNRTIMDLPNIAHEVHQLHIIETTRSKMQVALPIVLIGILLLINVFFYFRI